MGRDRQKNAHKRRDNKQVKPELRSRLVGCGNFEETEGLRTDSPTGSADSHNLVFSWCASNKVRVKFADISSVTCKENKVAVSFDIGFHEKGYAQKIRGRIHSCCPSTHIGY